MTSSYGRVLLITGGAEFLVERTVSRAVAAVVEETPDVQVTEVVGSAVGPGQLVALTSPSLFSAATIVVVRELEDLPETAHADLLAYVGGPAPEVACVLVHTSGAKGKGLLDKVRKTPAVSEVACAPPKAYELPRWVTAEVRQLGGSITDEAAGFLVIAVGQDLRALAGAADQLVSAAGCEDGGRARISTELVRQYFGGRADVKGFDVADAAIEGRLGVALEQLRWAINNGVAPVLVTSAFASGLRSLARLQAAPRGLREADLLREIGAQPFRLKSLRRQLPGWDERGLASALVAVARADLDVKGGAADADHALEQMLLRVVRARR